MFVCVKCCLMPVRVNWTSILLLNLVCCVHKRRMIMIMKEKLMIDRMTCTHTHTHTSFSSFYTSTSVLCVSPSSTDFYSIIIPSLLQRTRAAAAVAATAARDQVDTSKTRATCECKFITFPFAADTVLSLFLSFATKMSIDRPVIIFLYINSFFSIRCYNNDW